MQEVNIKLMTSLQAGVSDDLQPLLEIAEGKKDIEKWNEYAFKLLENLQQQHQKLEMSIRLECGNKAIKIKNEAVKEFMAGLEKE